MEDQAFQDRYAPDFSQCFGCGAHNQHGHQIKSYWRGEVSVASFTPDPAHISVPGFVYGGLIASLIDCHGIGTAAATAHREAGSTDPFLPRFVTGSLKVDFIAPTPLGPNIELVARPFETGERKIVVDVEVSVEGALCARGSVVAVRMPPTMSKN